MIRCTRLLVLMGLCCLAMLLATPTGVPAQEPCTMWSFLGIPQTWKHLQTNWANRNGNHPGLEPKQPLKAIADKANLEKMPNGEDKPKAIKTAAEVKQKEDMKKQKIKGLKYLAEVGCGCYPGVAEAFMEAMDPKKECTEEVRYEAVQAVIAATDKPCAACGQNGCCKPELIKKMAELAFLKDESGCWREPSPRVRAALQQALSLCCPNGTPIVVPGGGGGDIDDSGKPKPTPVPDTSTPDGSVLVPPPETSSQAPTAPGEFATLASGVQTTLPPPPAQEVAPSPPVPVADTVLGRVLRVDVERQIVDIDCAQACRAMIGSTVTISRDFMTGAEVLGGLEVVSAADGQVVARLQRLRQIPRFGDRAIVFVHPQANSAAARE